MVMKITVIGTVPPCPRCQRISDLAVESANELGVSVEMKKLAFDSEEARSYGKTGTAHDIAEWAKMEFDWSQMRNMVTEGWSKELDDFLMPCKDKAEEQGWLMTPVLLIDDKVAVMGYVPSKEDIKAAIQKAAGL
jgi:predicted DsbA family dithiol-disulfide isomerase